VPWLFLPFCWILDLPSLEMEQSSSSISSLLIVALFLLLVVGVHRRRQRQRERRRARARREEMNLSFVCRPSEDTPIEDFWREHRLQKARIFRRAAGGRPAAIVHYEYEH